MPIQRSGFGGRHGSKSTRASGKQNIVDRAGSKHNLIRSIAGSDIATWLDMTLTSNVMDAAVTSIDTIEGIAPANGTNAPDAVYSSVLNSTAYHFDTDEALKYDNGVGPGASGLFPAGLKLLTIAARWCIVSTPSNNLLFELGNSDWYSVDGGIALGAVDNTGTKFYAGIGDAGASDRSWFINVLAPKNTAFGTVTTYDLNANPDTIKYYKDGPALAQGGQLNKNVTHAVDVTQKAYIGNRSDNGSLCLDGHLSDFIIIKRELNDSESNRLSLAFSIA